MRRIIATMALLLFISFAVNAQSVEIKGKITDENGPVANATIQEKGTKNSVNADANGVFLIKVKQLAVLVISAVGRETIEVASSSEFMNVSLVSKTGELSEVVVTALGIRRNKNTLPFAAQTVAAEDINRSRTANFANTLSGRVAGLDIKGSNTLGGSTNIVLRGNKSIFYDNQALIVVDGIPYNNSAPASGAQRGGRGGYDYGNNASDINPDDIESVTVLKGAAASALYGQLGFNGVILITTKKPKKGLGITINSGINYVTTDLSTFPTYQKKYGGGYGTYYEDPSGYFLYRDVDGNGTKDLVVPTSEDASYGAPFDPNKMVYQWDAFDPTSPNFGKARPWVAAANDPTKFLESPVNFNNSVFIAGGDDKSSFKVGYTRNDDKGILPNSKITKNALNLSAGLNITPKFIATAAFNYTKTDGTGRYGTGYDDKNPMSSFRQWWQVNTDILELRDAYFRNRNNITWNWADPTDLVPIYWDNPYFTRYESFSTDSRSRYFGNATLNYKITSYLNLMGRVSMDNFNFITEERVAKGSIGVPAYARTNLDYRETNYDFLANFDKNIFSDKLNFKALVGANLRRTITNQISASTNGGLVVPRLYSIANSLNVPNAANEYSATREIGGVFGGVTFTYDEMITLDATLRRDQSSTLPKGANAYNYPSVSAGFIFSKLLSNVSWLSYGKLRANYAEVGKDAPSYAIDDTYGTVTPFGSQTLFSVSTTKNNNELKPERTRSWEAGLEMSFLKQRVGFDLTYYNATSFDQIIPVAVSRATGYNSKFVNSGSVVNKGIELSVFATPVRTKDFSWNVNLTWTRNRNKVISLYEGVDNILLGSFQGGVTINASVGQPFGTIRGKDFIYDAKTGQRTVGSNGRYLQTDAANNVIGDPNPDWIGGFSNRFRYKNFELGFLIDVRQGGQLFSLDMYYGLATGLYPETAGLNDLGKPLRSPVSDGGGIIRPGVKADGTPNDIRVSAVTYGAYGYRYAPAAGFIYDAGYVKLREASLSYSLPSKILSKIAPFKGVEFSLVGRNLWIIAKDLPYSDPEESYGAGNLQGYQGNAYPTTRNVAFNIKFKF